MKVYPFSHFPPYPNNLNGDLAVKLRKAQFNAALFSNDAAFDWMYPEHLQLLSLQHWTRLAIVQKIAGYLAAPGSKVLDLGSGIGKFCLAGAFYHPDCSFYGVEQRHELVHFAEEARQYTGVDNAHFLHANITQVDFNDFDHFYFYNSFYENLDPDSCIDDTIATSPSLYNYYTRYLYHALAHRPAGTRLVTFHTLDEEVPPGYELADVSYDTLLKMWIKA